MAQTLRGLCYKICSAKLQRFFAFGLFILVFEISNSVRKQLLIVVMLREHLRFVYINSENYKSSLVYSSFILIPSSKVSTVSLRNLYFVGF